MHILKRIETMLDLPDAEKAQVMRELNSHYEEIRNELLASGMEPARAEEEAGKRLGDPAAVASRLSAVHCVAPWKSAFWAVVPFLPAGFAIARHLLHGVWADAMLVLLVLSGVLIVAGTVRGFRSGGRPVWLPIWTAASISAVRVGIIAAGYELAGRGLPSSAYLLFVSVVLPAVVAIWLCWRLRRWRLVAVLIPACGIALYLLLPFVVDRALPITGMWRSVAYSGSLFLVIMAVWVMLALRVFALHRCGSAAQAALFLFGMQMAAGFGANPLNPFFPWWNVLGYAIVGTVAVLAFARAPSFPLKIAILGAALVVTGTLTTIVLLQTSGYTVASYIIVHWVSVLTGLGAISAAAIYHLQHRLGTLCSSIRET